MSDAKFTPGPWKTTPRGNNMIDIVHENNRAGAITKAVCRVQARQSWVQEAEANARLIAAAPELVDACETLLAELVAGPLCRDEVIAAARAAIAKATA